MAVKASLCRWKGFADKRWQIRVVIRLLVEERIANVDAVIFRAGADQIGWSRNPYCFGCSVTRKVRDLRVDQEPRTQHTLRNGTIDRVQLLGPL
ncbi:hypothetical protein X756_23350 [Mesorhizobium sp. LSHC412B00]|nr:hypothetical protein X756_23350 [Mesorhizobium sp. LSHC412B00]